jgi:hypothetical protein
MTDDEVRLEMERIAQETDAAPGMCAHITIKMIARGLIEPRDGVSVPDAIAALKRLYPEQTRGL